MFSHRNNETRSARGVATVVAVPSGRSVEVRQVGRRGRAGPTVVLLHHGLGSISTWKDFPEQVAAATGLPVLAYSRFGYGRSTPAAHFPWSADFMHRAASDELHPLLLELGLESPILVGHSDGGSIALLYAALEVAPAPLAMALLAPHVTVEECSVPSVERAVREFERGDLRDRLARYHGDPESAFRGWSSAWLSPDFRRWNIEAAADRIACPTVVIYGTEDEYGTVRQAEAIRRRRPELVETLILEGCGHAPHRERPAETLGAIARLTERVASA